MREDQVLQIMALARRRSPIPLLVGEVALALKLSLKDSENLLEDLLEQGRFRHATDAECRQFDIRFGFVALR